jgi:muramoyltetrapeptide carboxypeptidase
LGLDLRPFPDLLRPRRYLAADDDHRLAQLQAALTEPGWAGVWAARGGFGMTRLLPRLDLSAVDDRWVLGFSDVTALFCALQHTPARCVHGPVVHSLPITDEHSVAQLAALLQGLPRDAMHGRSLVPGDVTAPLVGGNLALLAATCGTPAQLDARGAILVLEDIGEVPYRLDRMMQQLASAGVLHGICGVALGEFVDCRPPEGADYTAIDVLMDHLEPLGVPVVADLPIGHGARNQPFVWGERARLVDARLIVGLAPVS